MRPYPSSETVSMLVFLPGRSFNPPSTNGNVSLYFCSNLNKPLSSSASFELAGRGAQYGQPLSRLPPSCVASSTSARCRASRYGAVSATEEVPKRRRMLEGVSWPVATRRRTGYLNSQFTFRLCFNAPSDIGLQSGLHKLFQQRDQGQRDGHEQEQPKT